MIKKKNIKLFLNKLKNIILKNKDSKKFLIKQNTKINTNKYKYVHNSLMENVNNLINHLTIENMKNKQKENLNLNKNLNINLNQNQEQIKNQIQKPILRQILKQNQ